MSRLHQLRSDSPCPRLPGLVHLQPLPRGVLMTLTPERSKMVAIDEDQPREYSDLIGVDGLPLTPLQWRIYLRAGIAPGDVSQWIAAGIRPYQAEMYREAGFDLPAAARLAQAGVPATQARQAGDVDEALRRAAAEPRDPLGQWTKLGIDRILAARAASALVAPHDVVRVVQSGFSAGKIEMLSESGVSISDVVRLVEAGYSAGHIETLSEFGVAIRDIVRLVQSGYRPGQIDMLFDSGIDIGRAITWRGLASPFQNLLNYLRALHGVNVDYDIVAALMSNRVPPKAARTWVLHGRISEEDLAWARFGFEPGEEASWAREGISPFDAFCWRDLGLGIDDATLYQHQGIRLELVRSLISLGFDATDLRTLTRSDRLGAEVLEKTVQLGIRAKEIVASDRSELGTRLLDVIESRMQPPTMMRVSRSRSDGSRSVTTVTGPDLWRVERDGNQAGPSYDTLEAAIRAEPDVHEVRRREILEIELNTTDEAVLDRIAQLLVLVDSQHLDEDAQEWAECDFPLVDDLIDAQAPRGIATRPVYLNGSRWLIIAAELAEPVLVRAADDPWGGRPLLVPHLIESWASLSAIEEASRVSGTSSWELGLVTPSVVCEVDDLDEAETAVRLRSGTAADRIHAIAQWVLEVDVGFDLLPLAVRTAADLDTDDMTAFGCSETLETELSLSIATDEIGHFLDLLRARRGNDEVDRFLT